MTPEYRSPKEMTKESKPIQKGRAAKGHKKGQMLPRITPKGKKKKLMKFPQKKGKAETAANFAK